ncbi:MAG: hypothetical protein ACFFEF_11825 [Candidatus Thorarchaeota archaeon]
MKRDEILQRLRNHGLKVISCMPSFRESLDSHPSLLVSHESYPNVEAHLFTAANASGWLPRLLATGDVEMSCFSTVEGYPFAWMRLLDTVDNLMAHLKSYRLRLASGDVPSFIWAHHEFQWHRTLWNSSLHPSIRPTEFIDYVDPSIRPHILKLNEYGFLTMESCSGLQEEHLNRAPYWPYVMFDERVYPGIAPHLFTLADISGWNAKYAPHNFDAYLKVRRGEHALRAFDTLVDSAGYLKALLQDYVRSLTSSGLSLLEWRLRASSAEGEA